ncbi:flavin-containing monooxygenase [Streptomyces sp. NPDC058470]|uniref:flavin-containing monooxygenase n=1 Tax=Streptomyces sp. NPDC058470 TaxID=3346515 RepID=UPI00365B7CDC
MRTERIETVVVGGGQAGLATGYHLARRGRSFVILDAGERIGDAWRKRWDSLRLFTPARYDSLPGLPFPGRSWSFPSAAEFADYLRDYAAWCELPVRTGVFVRRLWHDGERYVVETAESADDGSADRECRYEAENVVVAAGFDRLPKTPDFAADLAPDVVRLHAVDYRGPAQLRDGDVLVVGAGNSGADIALELSATHRVLLSGRHPGNLPWRIDSAAARVLSPLLFFAFRHVLTVRTPIGRKARPRILTHSGPLIRVKSRDLAAAGVERVGRVVGVRDGQPFFADGSDGSDGGAARVANVVWCTGFAPDHSWIDLPVFGTDGEPRQRRGVVDAQPGLYFVGGLFQHSLSSSMVQGVGRDAGHVVEHLDARAGRVTRAARLTGARG